ncbi:hypothetical protein [Hwangdonia seohaensis]|uniref:Uncharacterized protein n=1 Tax=Hwangdonia seohaensis TaxID=1240727 RepID=A0ABW3RCQ2_9FLAO|nr:hypothetical protein [Hwangdonia seohaensis]
MKRNEFQVFCDQFIDLDFGQLQSVFDNAKIKDATKRNALKYLVLGGRDYSNSERKLAQDIGQYFIDHESQNKEYYQDRLKKIVKTIKG